MILYRTKLFGFYDESGKLLEKYTKGPAKKDMKNGEMKLSQIYNNQKEH